MSQLYFSEKKGNLASRAIILLLALLKFYLVQLGHSPYLPISYCRDDWRFPL